MLVYKSVMDNDNGGGSNYTAGDGIDITNDIISTKQSEEGDIDEIIDIYPQAGNLVSIVNAFNKGDIYNTEERMIGQWIDGKPLYQRVVEGTLPSTYNDDWHIIYTGDNAMVICDMEFLPQYIYQSSALNDGYFGNGSSNVMSVIFKNNIIYCVINTNGSYMVNHSFKAIIRYTKTTDTAISIGSETEYSTDEKVVGTWIDGKPIYQRTVQMTLPAKNSDTTLDVSSWNINLVVSCQGTSASMQSAPMTTYVGDGNYHYHCFVNMPNKLLYVRNLGSTLGVGDAGYVTIQYTKYTT